jgi:hypothetical protein
MIPLLPNDDYVPLVPFVSFANNYVMKLKLARKK